MSAQLAAAPDLAANHRELIIRSGISDEVARARGYRSCSSRAELDRLGFRDYQQRPGLLVPLWDVHGALAGYQLRPDEPRLNSKGEPIKYETPKGQRHVLDVPPPVCAALADPGIELWVTEGSRKADAAASSGLCCVSLAGVWSWRGTNERGGKVALSDWDSVALNGRTVLVCFDSDAAQNPHVATAERRLHNYLSGRGAAVRVVRLSAGANGKAGLDDYLAAGGDVAGLRELATDQQPDTASGPARLTDAGNAERLIELRGADLLFDWTSRRWYAWDGRRWEPDAEAAAWRAALDSARDLYARARELPDPSKAALWALSSEAESRLRAATTIARAARSIIVRPEQLDTDPWLLCCDNGTLDLRTGVLHPHRREDRLTRLVPHRYNPDAEAPTWLRFLERVLPDAAVREFVQRALGMCLSGELRDQVVLVVSGPGANGKSTALNATREVMGDYATMAAPGVLLSTKYEQHPTGYADLVGRRLVTSIEAAAGRHFDEPTIKALSGGETLKARRMRADFTESRVTFHVVVGVNERPRITARDEALWRRVLLVPFDVTVPAAERDPGLPAKLRAEYPGILAWLVWGCAEWQRRGLDPPSAVVAATSDYRGEMDTVQAFVSSECELGPDYCTTGSVLHEAYAAWCADVGRPAVTLTTFGRELGRLGFEMDKRGGKRGRWGLQLAPAGRVGQALPYDGLRAGAKETYTDDPVQPCPDEPAEYESSVEAFNL